ncbi:MAG: helix-turn-helix domain-containing protein [Treponema sp.]|nr:helix-turn-helix domain-containing protein [Treponema sp.]
MAESLGNTLKMTREGKGYTFEQVSMDTHISIQYLRALEEERFNAFPGEPYILGFLKNYGEYLGLDNKELLFQYRSGKIQDQPDPINQLITPRGSSLPFKMLLDALILVIVLATAGGGVYYFLYLPRTKTPIVTETRKPVEYALNEGALERRFYLGDSIVIPYGDDQYTLRLSNVGDAVTIMTPVGGIILDLSQEVRVDLNNDGMGELRITASDFDKNTGDSGALLRFEMDSTLPFYSGASIESPESVPTPVLSSAMALPDNTGLTNATQILSSVNAYPFTMEVAFQGYCMFRWEILYERDRQDRNEQYFQRGDALNMQAQNGIRLWASNAAATKIQVIGGGRTVPVELGGAGEVAVVDIRWVRDNDGRYRLVMIRL